MIESRIGFCTLVRREVVRYFVVWTQTLVPPLISTALFIFVFGFSIGKNLQVAIHGVRYLDFLVPGLVSMHLIESAYTNSSSSLFMSRWHNMIQEVLLSPLSYFEMVLALLLGSLSRALIVSAGVWGISLLFTHFQFQHPWVVAYFAVVIATLFASLGLLAGLWAEGYEKLSVWGTFVLTPLIYFGGVFHSIDMVPAPLQILTHLDPIFYLVNGMRYGMLGLSDAPLGVCMAVAGFLALGFFAWVIFLFKIGYKLRT